MTASRGRTGRPPLTEARRTEIRREIARAAVDLFVSQGVTSTTGEQIGRAVGLSARTVWRYFPSKESCVTPLFSEGIDSITTFLREWPPGQSLQEAMDRWLVAETGIAAWARPGHRRRPGPAHPDRTRTARRLAPDVRRGRAGCSVVPSPSGRDCRSTICA